jgi:hypothetical protein
LFEEKTMKSAVSPAEFVEELGMHFEANGDPRIAGRLLATTLLSDQALDLDELAGALRVSKGSVSTNTRLLRDRGLLKQEGRPGKRKRLFSFAGDAWEKEMHGTLGRLQKLHGIARAAVLGLKPDQRLARARLLETIAFCEFVENRVESLLEQWREEDLPLPVVARKLEKARPKKVPKAWREEED